MAECNPWQALPALHSHIAPTCSYAAAAYLQSIGFNQRVFLIGNEGVAEELEAASIDYVTLEQLCAEAAGSSNGSGSNGSSNANGVASSAAALQQQWTAEGLAKLQVGAECQEWHCELTRVPG